MFKEQIDALQSKTNIPTRAYTDLIKGEYDYAFAVAGATRNEVLGDLRTAVDEAIKTGQTLENFKKDFDNISAVRKWNYKGSKETLGRARVIYDTNVYSSFNSGRLQQHLELKDVMPFWEYQHNANSHPREKHVKWNRLVLRADDPWWEWHYPTKAHGCHCGVVAHSDESLEREGLSLSSTPKEKFITKTYGKNSGNSKTLTLPEGVGPGFVKSDFKNINSSRYQSVSNVVFGSVENIPAKLGAKLANDVLQKNSGTKALINKSFASIVKQVNGGTLAGDIFKIGVISSVTLDKLDELSMPAIAVIAVEANSLENITPELLKNLPNNIGAPDSVMLDSDNKSLIYVYKDKGALSVKLETNKETPKLNIITQLDNFDASNYKEL